MVENVVAARSLAVVVFIVFNPNWSEDLLGSVLKSTLKFRTIDATKSHVRRTVYSVNGQSGRTAHERVAEAIKPNTAELNSMRYTMDIVLDN